MGIDWAHDADNLFEDLSPMEAMEKLRQLVDKGGDTAINNDPKQLQLLRSMARVKDQDINVWVNNWVPDRNPAHIIFLDQQIRYYRDKCREALDMGPAETRVN